jgi:NitT/TauT family transport system permease protein
MTTLDPRWKWMRQLAAFAVLLLLWETAGRAGLLNPLFVPSPSLIGRALYELFADGRIWPHIDATFTAALLGLALGILAGVLLGVIAALLPPVAELLEPVMTLLNAIPRVVLAPLFVIWLGIDLASKVALSFILVAVVIFFTVFNGIRLSPVVCAVDLQLRSDVRADLSDHGGGSADLRSCGPPGKISAALELSAAEI